jgi:DNA-binding NtrC family response regulator
MNVLERLAILSTGEPVDSQDVRRLLPAPRKGHPPPPAYQDDDPRTLRERLEDYERTLIRGALKRTRGNVAEAGRRLQTDRPNLYRRMKRLGLRHPGED